VLVWFSSAAAGFVFITGFGLSLAVRGGHWPVGRTDGHIHLHIKVVGNPKVFAEFVAFMGGRKLLTAGWHVSRCKNIAQ
jgi:hypothetical protein